MRFSLYSPNGEFGCLTIIIWHLTFTFGLRPGMWGADISYKDEMLFAIPRNQKL